MPIGARCVSRGHALTLTDSSNQASPIDAPERAVENQPVSNSLPADATPPEDQLADAQSDGPRRRILIGSQRDPAAYRAAAPRLDAGRGVRGEAQAATQGRTRKRGQG